MKKELTGLSKFVSLVLRHKPEEIGLVLDKNGWADVEELLEKANLAGAKLNMEILNEIVETNEKKRFSFSNDQLKIRANQGHSIEVDVQLKTVAPPDVLYHGTAKTSLDEILKSGINRMSRLHVHLSESSEDVLKVGGRHGKPVALQIDTKAMHANGIEFYLSQNNVWLVEHVPAIYIQQNQNNI